MGKRGDRKMRQPVTSNPGSSTPWYYDHKTFAPKKPTHDPRATSDFFAEFSTESLFTSGPAAQGPTDPYEVLGLFPGSTLGQVKKAHRKLAKRYHPDRYMTAPEPERLQAERRMIQVNAAYAELLARISREPT